MSRFLLNMSSYPRRLQRDALKVFIFGRLSASLQIVDSRFAGCVFKLQHSTLRVNSTVSSLQLRLTSRRPLQYRHVPIIFIMLIVFPQGLAASFSILYLVLQKSLAKVKLSVRLPLFILPAVCASFILQQVFFPSLFPPILLLPLSSSVHNIYSLHARLPIHLNQRHNKQFKQQIGSLKTVLDVNYHALPGN